MQILNKIITIIFILSIASISWATHGTGIGINRDQALNNAFQNIIESEIGLAVQSETVVENLKLAKDEIVTHSKGYVTSYEILSEIKDNDGNVKITIDAYVNKDLLINHAQTLEIFMKMAGHPSVIVFGVSDDIESIPAGTEIFYPLINSVSRVFSKKFKFDVLDWSVLRLKHKEIEGTLDRAKVIKYNKKLMADYIVTVKLNILRDKKLKLIMSSVRISDNFLLGEIERPIEETILTLKPPALYRAAVKAAQKNIFLSSMSLAQLMIEGIQTELDRGKGFRYLISLLDFPDIKKIENILTELSGYVRHTVSQTNRTDMELSYWSNLQSGTLLSELKNSFDSINLKYKYKMDRRVLKFQWQHPEGF